MVSRRNYFSIAAIMLVVLFMFQFTNVALELWNDYENNKSAVDVSSLWDESDAFIPEDLGAGTTWGTERPGVVFVGSADSALGQVTYQWATYAKWSFAVSPGLIWSGSDIQTPELIVLDGAGISWDEASCQTLLDHAAAGSDIVFATLPAPSVIRGSRELRELLGIYSIRAERTKAEGLHLYEGFLLGGEVLYQGRDEEDNEQYQDLDLEMPWYVLDSGTKVYMKGIPLSAERAEDHPAVIWRRSLGNSYLFAVNGRYMEDVAGLGLLSAMVSETESCTVYPVVNAQNLVVANYPGLAAENGDDLMLYYSMPMRGLYQDVLWPDFTAVYHRGGLGLTCMMSVQFDYSDSRQPDQERLVYYMKLINELGAEAGLSSYCVSDTPVAQRLSEDFAFLNEAGLDYPYTSLYAGGLTEEELDQALSWTDLSAVRTVAEPYDGSIEVVGYQTEQVTRQMAVTDGFDHTFMADFRMRSLETALAYTSVLADAARLVYPESGNDTWDKLSQKLTSNVPSRWNRFSAFDATTLSECDGRIRNFLSMDYTSSCEGNQVSIQHSGGETAWFILRAPGKTAAQVDGGSARQVEDGVYLIEAQARDVTVTLRPAHFD